jgi:hypothetical protein
MTVRFVNQPSNYRKLIGEMINETTVWKSGKENIDLIHFFTNSTAELEEKLPEMKEQIKKNGCIWVSWFKKTSGKSSELNDHIVRDTALALGLVDVKVCSVSDDWSGQKLVYRLRDR